MGKSIVTEQLYTSEKLAQMHSDLWECVLQFANFSAIQERHRIARDLHDSLGHVLTALNFQLQTAIQLCKPDSNQAYEFLNEAHRLVKVASQEVRQSVKALRNDELETQSLEKLIESLVNDFEQTTGILPQVKISLSAAIPSQFVTPIYRIIQEALNNICKYAIATAVQIHISTNSDKLYLKIQDNGRGFDPEQVYGGYGLQVMEERVSILQGSFQLESQPGHGCCIMIKIPMHISNKFYIFQCIEQKDNFSTMDIMSIDSETQIAEKNLDIQLIDKINNSKLLTVYPTNISQYCSFNCEHQICKYKVEIGEWQPLNLNYLL